MAKFIIAAFAIILVLGVVFAAPEKSIKELRQEAERKKACLKDCSTEPVKAICGGQNGQKQFSFGSVCALNNYNCEHSDSGVRKVSEGECPNSKGIRLS